ncbi:hypothetical protein [Chryseobacterium sp. 18068]|uniref:hypothetical protein n=1 Tax=Chryseobacterium sp. 18068 TaxID=2681414 RepID=UPI001357DFF4|nr:hypothetical protein [Chryseobacterium sp. 18068]
MKYENRICCFIDILGFKQHINETINVAGEDNSEKINSIKNIIDLSKSLTNDHGFSDTKVITYFSDSIVISYEFSEPSQLYHTLNDLLFVSFELANKGYLIRGGVSIGKLIHTNELIFGPALVKAYELESKKAIYPRILVEQYVVENGVIYREKNHSEEDEHKFIMDILTEDVDGNYYIDYISKGYSEFDDIEYDIYPYLEKLKSFLNNYSNERDDVKEKLYWLNDKISNAISQIHVSIESENFNNIELRDYYRTLHPLKVKAVPPKTFMNKILKIFKRKN